MTRRYNNLMDLRADPPDGIEPTVGFGVYVRTMFQLIDDDPHRGHDDSDELCDICHYRLRFTDDSMHCFASLPDLTDEQLRDWGEHGVLHDPAGEALAREMERQDNDIRAAWLAKQSEQAGKEGTT